MMNPLIKKQLDKVRRVTLEPYDDSTTTIHINRRTDGGNLFLEQDKCYLISIEDYILNPPDGFTLHTNWNNGIAPMCKVLKIDVSKIMGKMIKVNAMGYDLKNQCDLPYFWEGWLPQKSITIIERL